MKILIRMAALIAATLCVTNSIGQTASGTSTTSCTQNGTVMTCTTATTVNLPSGVNLQSGSGLGQFGLSGTSSGPACTSLSASPSAVAAGGGTTVVLSVACPSGSYTYAWASPAAPASGAATTDTPNLSAQTPSQDYSVTVCLAAAPTSCNTYTTSVVLLGGTSSLSSCSVSPSSTSVSTGATPVLNATCLPAAATGANSGVTYAWKRNGSTISGANGASYQLTTSDTSAAGSSTYQVTVANNAPSTQSASSTVTVTASQSGTDYCPTIPVRDTFSASSAYTRFKSTDYVTNFLAGENFVIKLDVTAGDSTAFTQNALMNFSDLGSTRGGRYVTISQNKCDFTSTAKWVSGYFLGSPIAQNSASKQISLNNPSGTAPIALTTGTWYINIKNVIGSCPSNTSCHVVLDWSN